MRRSTTSAMSDRDLIAAARTGDQAAIAALWTRHHDAAVTRARTFVDRAMAEDLAADAFLKVVTALRNGVGPEEVFRPYLYTVLRNLATAEYRRRAAVSDDAVEFDLIAGDVDEPSAAIARELDKSTLGRAFGSLPERWQSVLWSIEVEGLRPRQIAPTLGMQAGAVSSLAHRARRALRAAWVQEHLALAELPDVCRSILAGFGAYEIGTMSRRERAQLEQHIEKCEHCPDVVEQARRSAARLAWVFLPLVGGIGAAKTAADLAAPTTSASAATGVDRTLPPRITAGAFIAVGSALAIGVAVGAVGLALDDDDRASARAPRPTAAAPERIAPEPRARVTGPETAHPSPTSRAADPPGRLPDDRAIGGTTTPAPGAPVPPRAAWATAESPPTTDPTQSRLAAPIADVRELLSRDRSVQLTGASVPGATVDVTGAVGVTRTTAGADGRWSATVTFADDGEFPLVLTAVKTAHRRSEPMRVLIQVDTTPPAAPTLDETWTATDRSAPTVTGTAEPGSAVTVVTVGRPSERVRTRAAGDGSWSVGVPGLRPTDPGVTATAVDEAGNESTTVRSTPFAFVPTVATPQSGTTLPTGPVTLTIVGWADTTVDVAVDGRHAGTIRLDDTGAATRTIVARAGDDSVQSLPPGPHSVTVAYTDDRTVSTHTATTTFTVV